MRSAPAIPSKKRSLRAWFGALVCLLAWFVGTPVLLPGVVAALGSLDGQHRVSFAVHGAQVAVVLHHPNAVQAPAHQHTPLAEMLTAFAECSGPTQDHVLAFAPTDFGCLATPIAQLLPSIVDARALAASFASLPVPQSFDIPALAPRPPPTCAFALVCLRSTTLLI
jgi:hypothetical protein